MPSLEGSPPTSRMRFFRKKIKHQTPIKVLRCKTTQFKAAYDALHLFIEFGEDVSRISLLIRFGYDGSRFHGLQPQKNLATAGGTLHTRLEEAAGTRPRALFFSARTDAGVHALENAATCWFNGPLDLEKFIFDMAQERDDGLHRVRVERVPMHIHARGSSCGKRYRYIIDDGCVDGYFHATHSWRILPQLNVKAMQEAAHFLQGEHDFTSFRGARCSAKTPIKNLPSIRVSDAIPVFDVARRLLPQRTGGRFDQELGPIPDEAMHERRIFIDVAGDAFLRKMIRILVGTLAEVGIGWRQPKDMLHILEAKHRQAAGVTAPARGLSLLQLGFNYPEDGSRRVKELRHLDEVRAALELEQAKNRKVLKAEKAKLKGEKRAAKAKARLLAQKEAAGASATTQTIPSDLHVSKSAGHKAQTKETKETN